MEQTPNGKADRLGCEWKASNDSGAGVRLKGKISDGVGNDSGRRGKTPKGMGWNRAVWIGAESKGPKGESEMRGDRCGGEQDHGMTWVAYGGGNRSPWRGRTGLSRKNGPCSEHSPSLGGVRL